MSFSHLEIHCKRDDHHHKCDLGQHILNTMQRILRSKGEHLDQNGFCSEYVIMEALRFKYGKYVPNYLKLDDILYLIQDRKCDQDITYNPEKKAFGAIIIE